MRLLLGGSWGYVGRYFRNFGAFFGRLGSSGAFYSIFLILVRFFTVWGRFWEGFGRIWA